MLDGVSQLKVIFSPGIGCLGLGNHTSTLLNIWHQITHCLRIGYSTVPLGWSTCLGAPEHIPSSSHLDWPHTLPVGGRNSNLHHANTRTPALTGQFYYFHITVAYNLVLSVQPLMVPHHGNHRVVFSRHAAVEHYLKRKRYYLSMFIKQV